MSASLRFLFLVLLLGGLWGTFAVPRARAAGRMRQNLDIRQGQAVLRAA